MQHGGEEPRSDHAGRKQGVHNQPGEQSTVSPKKIFFSWLEPPLVPRASGAWPCQRQCWSERPSPGCLRWEST